MEQQHWCSFCCIRLRNELSLKTHLDTHEKQTRVHCNMCSLSFLNNSHLGDHIRNKHSPYISNIFAENAEKNITDITPEVQSDSEWTDSSEEDLTSSDIGDISEGTDFENVEEPVEYFSNEEEYIVAQNMHDTSDNKILISEFDQKAVNTKHMNNSDGDRVNLTSCGVAFRVKLEWGKGGIYYLNITRHIPNSEDNSERHRLQKHMEPAFLSSDQSTSSQGPRKENTDADLRDENQNQKTRIHNSIGQDSEKQTPWIEMYDKDDDQLDCGEIIAMATHFGVHEEEELIQIKEDHEQTTFVDLDSEQGMYNGENKSMICDEEELRRENEDHEETSSDDLESDNEDNIDYMKTNAMIPQNNVQDEEELRRVNEDHEQTTCVDLDSEQGMYNGENKSMICDEEELRRENEDHEETSSDDLESDNEDNIDYMKTNAMIPQNNVQDEEELRRVNEDHELAISDVVHNPKLTVWTEAINILKDTFMKKKKRARKRGMFATTNRVTFTKWLTANFPVEGVLCGCGRHLKTPTSLLGHLRRKSTSARQKVKLFKKGI
ncbi:uncharacterized protein LOC134700341 isoform X2 [Mytilus trossulus]|uniref:uncharacterized protein LOC134700341 isoform X2 n=1 Tax=Mytilus trossulus TaxID=6551 RepID=UPI0030046EB4